MCGTHRFMKVRDVSTSGPWLLINCPVCNLNDATLRVLANTEGWTET
jgi:hypothetical protein